MNSLRRPKLNCRTGTAALELAVLLPLLLLIVFGCIDFGRVMYYSIALENAVGTGSDYAATHRFTDFSASVWENRVHERVIEEMQGVPDFDPAVLNIIVETLDGPQESLRVIVTATYPFQTVVEWPGVPHNVILRHRVSAWQYR